MRYFNPPSGDSIVRGKSRTLPVMRLQVRQSECTSLFGISSTRLILCTESSCCLCFMPSALTFIDKYEAVNKIRELYTLLRTSRELFSSSISMIAFSAETQYCFLWLPSNAIACSFFFQEKKKPSSSGDEQCIRRGIRSLEVQKQKNKYPRMLSK